MNNHSVLYRTFKAWVPVAVATFVLTGLVYAAVQQNYRQSANDPQIQVAQDLAAAVSSGQAPANAIVPSTPTQEMSPSLATFVIIYSATGTPIGSSVSLDGKLPALPSGVFDKVKVSGEDRFTWEPKKDIRIAAVVQSFFGQEPGFVLVGRSIREIEIRERNLLLMSVVAGLAAWALAFLAIWLMLMMEMRPHKEMSDAHTVPNNFSHEGHHDHAHNNMGHHEHPHHPASPPPMGDKNM